ncbi:MAG: hypothetical protein ABEK36_06515 [Candidatus Aenigmatarchaeota archaeon]
MEEVEINADDEYEVVPMGPIKKLEKRIDKIEGRRSNSDVKMLIRDVMDLMKSNQNLVDEIVKADDQLREELSKTRSKIDDVIGMWQDFIEIMKEAGAGESATSGLEEKFDRLLEQNEKMMKINKKLAKVMSSGSKSSKNRFSPTSGNSGDYPNIRIRKNQNQRG